jgi:thioredoxin-related protein
MRRINRPFAATLLTLLCVAGGEPGRPAIYDENADAKKDVAAAIEVARAENQRVLLMIGGNWCGWCHKLHETFASEEIRPVLRAEYKVVNVDGGQGDKNKDLLDKYGITPNGYPYLAVIDPTTDKLLIQQETGALEEGDHHSQAKVLDFLTANQAPAQDANQLLSSALDEAKSEQKSVFLRFGAPWCGWCHKLDDVLRQPAVAEALGADLVVLKVDVDRMTGGKEIQKKYQTAGGIPWFAVLSPDGTVVAKSELAGGSNIGFPTEPAEIDHVVKMLCDGGKKMTDAQKATVRKAFEDAAAKVKAAQAAANPRAK